MNILGSAKTKQKHDTISMSENPFQDQADDIEIPEFDELPKLTSPISSKTLNKSNTNSNSNVSSPLSSKPLSSEKRAKLEALRQREAELVEKKKKLEQATSELIPQNNFPSFFPLIRYNPEEDLPQSSHKCIGYCLKMLIFLSITCVFNIFAVLTVSGLKSYNKLNSLAFACIQGFAAIYFALNFSYNLLYISCRKRDIPFKWTLYQFLVIGWCLYITLGFPNSGSVGIATMLDILANKTPFISKLFSLVNTGLCLAATTFAILTLSAAQAYQKVSGKEDPLINVPEA